MSNVKELLIAQDNGSLCFGDYSLDEKTKLSDFAFEEHTYKVKTFKEITRLEKNGAVLFESVPGSAVHNFKASEGLVEFDVESADDIEITLGLAAEAEYKVYVDDTNIGKMKANLGGKINFSIELNAGQTAKVRVVTL
ncbi:MAG: endosialidase [Eubacteriales bacterium]|nr:endosialidase [Eubacteriales bacterium]